jgi:hypothetical protein
MQFHSLSANGTSHLINTTQRFPFIDNEQLAFNCGVNIFKLVFPINGRKQA